MSDEPTVVAAGERGPTGDHGQTGDTGRTGLTGARGLEGTPGLDGPPGHIGLTGAAAPKERTLLLSVLKTITVLMGLIIIGTALWITVVTTNDNQRLVEDRDASRRSESATRAELAELREELDLERESDACYDAYGSVMMATRQHRDAVDTQLAAAIARALLTFLPPPFVVPDGAVLDPEALLELTEDADAASLADEAALQARDDWVADGRPLPCPLG